MKLSYQFADDIDLKSIFVFNKNWIENLNWASLSKASKAIFPVILSHCNGKGLAFPSERRIAVLSGRPDKSVREGIRGLDGFPGFKVGYRITNAGKRGKRFHMNLPQIEKGKTFPFHRCVIYGGNWSQMTPTATALYPVMRHFGFFDFDAYQSSGNLDIEMKDFDEVYKNREYDYSEAEVGIMAKFAGISRRSVGAALHNLETNYLIEQISPGFRKVFLIPPKHFKRSFLNQQVIDRYKHENRDGKKYRS